MSRPKHIKAESTTYFITTVTEGRLPIFTNPIIAKVVIDALYFLRGEGRLKLYGFVVMPEHLHLLIRAMEPIPKLMHSLKSFTAKKIDRLSNSTGKIWQDGYYDYGIRTEQDFLTRLRYLEENPIRKGLVTTREDYPFSSANKSFEIDTPF